MQVPLLICDATYCMNTIFCFNEYLFVFKSFVYNASGTVQISVKQSDSLNFA